MTVTTSNHGVLKANDPCWCGSGKKFKRCHKTANTNIRPGRQSPMRPVPPEIPRPPYAESGEVVRHPVSPVTPPDVLERMRVRSEEHTSELQSLMRSSYAVFCLTKNRHQSTTQQPTHT